jgi:hypothetical protein
VQLGAATDGVSVVPEDTEFTNISGEIVTSELQEFGRVGFRVKGLQLLRTGHTNVIPPEHLKPMVQHWWLRNWSYLVPFPAPPTQSVLTYRFNVLVIYAPAATFMSFVSVDETANLAPARRWRSPLVSNGR